MATTNSGFLRNLANSTVQILAIARGYVVGTLAGLQSGSTSRRLDRFVIDLSADGLAKNGSTRFAFTTSTTKTLDLTNTATNSAQTAGDTVFASFTRLVIYNDSTTAISVTVGAGASNGASIPFTTGSLTLAQGGEVGIVMPSATTVDATHKNIDITSTNGGSLIVTIGGA